MPRVRQLLASATAAVALLFASLSIHAAPQQYTIDPAHTTVAEARDKHVRNKDFLDVKAYPEMSFTASTATIDEAGAGEINGELTLLGQTLPLSLSVQLNKAENYPFGHKRFTLGVSATGSLKRSEYGMDYGVANALVGDEVQLIIETEAIQDK